MTRDELFSLLRAAPPAPDDVLYIARRGDDYACRNVGSGGLEAEAEADAALPDVWIYYAGRWPLPDEPPERWRAFFDDLLDEMESMAGGMDRCRWPLNEPWPHRH